MGIPNTRQSAVLAVDVLRLSQNAACESSEVISEPKSPQSTLARIATSGSSTNATPTRAGTYTHRGRSTGRGAVTGRPRSRLESWLGEAGLLQDGLPLVAGHEVDELLGEVGALRALERHDRVGVHDAAGLRER